MPVVGVEQVKTTGRANRRFWADESGSLLIFALMLAMLMMMMGGIAVDVMRYESRRTSLQNTLDRSTLAAASMTQDLDPESVVDDYFLKAGLAEFLTSVTVTEGLNFSSVTATAEADTEPLFLQMMGIDEFNAPGMSTAEQRITNVEVILVLDVSYSMNSNSRLANLKLAAKKFVADVLAKDTEKRISIGIVPFNGSVNLGTALLGKFNAQYPHGTANITCLDLPDSVFAETDMDRALAIPMTTNADPRSGTWQNNGYVATNDGNAIPNNIARSCPAVAGNVVRLPKQDIGELQGNIEALQPAGYTSINAGLKWGLAMMDPEARPMFTELIASTDMNALSAGRPFDYDDEEAMKVIVLMTDGENTADVRMVDTYKHGFSGIFKSNDDSKYSVFHSTATAPNQYYVPHLGTWQATPWSNSASTGTYQEQTWPQIWDVMRVSYVAWQFYARPLGGSSGSSRSSYYDIWMDNFLNTSVPSEMDTQLNDVCDLAKEQNVTVYGIAFEAPSVGQAAIRACSTNAEDGTHFFRANGSEITAAFSAIANNISQLRLTQ